MIDPQEFKNLFQQNIQLHRHKGIDSPQIDYGDLLSKPATGATCTVLIPKPNFIVDSTNTIAFALNGTSVVLGGMYTIPFKIVVSKLYFTVSTVTASGTIAIAIYTEDGQTLVNGANVNVTAIGLQTVTFNTTLNAGNYYFLMNPTTGTPNINLPVWVPYVTAPLDKFVDASITGKVVTGRSTGGTGTLPNSFNPNTFFDVPGTATLPPIRLDS